MQVCYLYRNAVVGKVPNFGLHTLKLNIAFENYIALPKLTMKRSHRKVKALYIVELLKWDTENNYEDFLDEQKLSVFHFLRRQSSVCRNNFTFECYLEQKSYTNLWIETFARCKRNIFIPVKASQKHTQHIWQ